MAEDPYLKLTARERLEVLDTVSRQRGIAASILEKDYWVCRTLAVLFALDPLGAHLVFKGGTSLSKAYGLIDRFSEDVDISFHREFLGFGPDADPEAATGNQQRKRLEALQQACTDCVRDRLRPVFEAAMRQELGSSGWSVEVAPDDAQTLLFHYPQSGVSSLSYIPPSVRIELGARSDHWPQERRDIRSLIGETINQPMGLATVQTLAAERTLWEKATLLHAEAHRAASQAMPARYARHYHDLARLALSPVADRALADLDLRRRVVAHKSVYFRSAWARYDLAVPGTFRLLPPPSRLADLERDHQAMKQMFFSAPPPIDQVLQTLSALETRIRSLPV